MTSDVEPEAPADDDNRVDDEEPLRTDPVTGSTPEEPDDTGLPPAGSDPMAGEAPSS